MEFFNTDWAAMSVNDWIGTLVTILVCFAMIWAYVFAFHPKNKEKLESQRHIIFNDDDDDNDTEDSK
jgi:cytochrome c oxidase cbb3-type subunit IV